MKTMVRGSIFYFNIKFKVREDATHKTRGLTKMLKSSQMINTDNDD